MTLLYNNTINSIRRHLFDPAYFSFAKSCRVEFWKSLEQSQFLSQQKLLEIQWKRLIDILSFVEKNNRFYQGHFKQAGITVADIRTPEDLLKLPILTKEQVRNNTDSMISSGFQRDTLLLNKTGGSTGKALEIYLTEECSEQRNACARRHDRWSGWEVGEPVAAVWGNPDYPDTLKAKFKEWLISPIMYLDTMSVSRQSVEQFARDWDHLKPTLLFGHAHSIFILAQFVKELKLDNIRPRGILSSSMMLMPHERRVIEQVFGVKVTDRYGCEEVSLIASECEMHVGMHLNIEHLYIEFIKDDGTAAKSWEPGKIIVTDLMNRAMPFIRYQVEDVGVPSDRQCSCGRGLPLMESVSGRMADFLRKRDGAQVAGISLIENTLTKYPGLDQMQIVQNDYDDFVVRIVPGHGFRDDILEGLTRFFNETFGSDINILYEKTVSIPPEASGKYRFTVCKIH